MYVHKQSSFMVETRADERTPGYMSWANRPHRKRRLARN